MAFEMDGQVLDHVGMELLASKNMLKGPKGDNMCQGTKGPCGKHQSQLTHDAA